MDEATFERLYTDMALAVKSYAFCACRDASFADDILQESFCRLLRVDISGWHRNQIKVYLYKTAASLISDHWRRQKRAESRLRRLSFSASDKFSRNPELPYDVTRLLAQLAPREQMLLWLAYVEGFSHREIALRMELREHSVRVLLYRARKKLATVLREAGLIPEMER